MVTQVQERQKTHAQSRATILSLNWIHLGDWSFSLSFAELSSFGHILVEVHLYMESISSLNNHNYMGTPYCDLNTQL